MAHQIRTVAREKPGAQCESISSDSVRALSKKSYRPSVGERVRLTRVGVREARTNLGKIPQDLQQGGESIIPDH